MMAWIASPPIQVWMPEPAAGDERAHKRGYMRPANAKCRTRKRRERNAVLGAGVAVNGERQQHQRIAEENRQQALPPVHPAFDHTCSQHIGRNAHAHPDPQRRNMPEIRGAVCRVDGRQVGVDEVALCELSFNRRERGDR